MSADEHEDRGPESDEAGREEAVTAADDKAANERQTISDDERARLIEEELKRLKVADLAKDMMMSFVAVGYQKLGLTAETRSLRDLDDAHLSIELLRVMIDVLAREHGVADVEAFRSTLDTMQLNYVRASEQGKAGPAAAGDPVPETEPAPETDPVPETEPAPGSESAPEGEPGPGSESAPEG
jgi:hypothetical protein